MRFYFSTLALTAAFIVCVHGVDLSDIPGYNALPEPSANKYDAAEATVSSAEATVGPVEATLVPRSVEEPEEEYVPKYAVDNFEPTHMPEEDLHTALHARDVDEEDDITPVEGFTEYYDGAGTLHTSPVDESPETHEGLSEEAAEPHLLAARSIEEPETFDWDDGELTEEEHQDVRAIEEDVAPSWQDDFEAGRISDEYYDEEGTLHKRSLADDFEPGSAAREYYDGEGMLHGRSEDDANLYYDPAHPGHDVDFRKRSTDEEDPDEAEPLERYEESGLSSAEDKTAGSGEPASPAAAPTPKPTPADTVSKAARTTGSQWSDVASETAGSGSSRASSALHARNGLPSHPRHRPHHAQHQGASAASGSTASSASGTTTKRGFFRLPW